MCTYRHAQCGWVEGKGRTYLVAVEVPSNEHAGDVGGDRLLQVAADGAGAVLRHVGLGQDVVEPMLREVDLDVTVLEAGGDGLHLLVWFGVGGWVGDEEIIRSCNGWVGE